MKKINFLVMLLFLATVNAQAQVTIGSKKIPSPFSILELISGKESNNGNRGLRLPQLTNAQRGILELTFDDQATTGAVGLRIFNISTLCVETWNGSEWVQSCYNNTPSTTVTVDDLCLANSIGLTYTYSASLPYLTPIAVEFFENATLVGVDTSAPFTHIFETDPTGDVTAVLSYPFFDAGAQPLDETIKINAAQYTMKGILGGNFNMGFTEEVYNAAGLDGSWGLWNDTYDGFSTNREFRGSHSVNVSSFSIGETEVTQKLFSTVYGYGGPGKGSQNGITLESITSGPTFSSSYGEGDDYPAYNVSWYDALVFCNRLSIIEGKSLFTVLKTVLIRKIGDQYQRVRVITILIGMPLKYCMMVKAVIVCRQRRNGNMLHEVTKTTFIPAVMIFARLHGIIMRTMNVLEAPVPGVHKK